MPHIKLGELLILNQVVTEKQIRKALERKELLGGRLGTNLLELGYISEVELSNFLAKQHGLPVLPPSALNFIPQELLSTIPRQLCQKHFIIPFKKEGSRLYIASLDPLDFGILDTLNFITQSVIRVHIAPEARIYWALHKYYAFPSPVRYLSIFQIKKHKDSSPTKIKEPYIVSEKKSKSKPLSKVNFELLKFAKNKNEIFLTLLEALNNFCERVILYEISNNSIKYWDDIENYRIGRKGEDFPFFISTSTFLSKYYKSQTVYCGPLPPSEENSVLIGAIGSLYPPEVVILPFPINNNLSYVIYGDNLISNKKISNLREIKKLHLAGVCAIKIYLLRKKIDEIASS